MSSTFCIINPATAVLVKNPSIFAISFRARTSDGQLTGIKFVKKSHQILGGITNT
jgi:hypothetical protein